MLILMCHNSDVLFPNLKFLYFATATGESLVPGFDGGCIIQVVLYSVLYRIIPSIPPGGK
jgi:hypothetical protein